MIKEQKELRKFIKVLKKVEIQEGKKHISIEPLENDLIVDFEIVYTNPLIRTRRKEFKLSDGDLTNIYNSRTFCLYEDIGFVAICERKNYYCSASKTEDAILMAVEL